MKQQGQARLKSNAPQTNFFLPRWIDSGIMSDDTENPLTMCSSRSLNFPTSLKQYISFLHACCTVALPFFKAHLKCLQSNSLNVPVEVLNFNPDTCAFQRGMKHDVSFHHNIFTFTKYAMQFLKSFLKLSSVWSEYSRTGWPLTMYVALPKNCMLWCFFERKNLGPIFSVRYAASIFFQWTIP